MRSAAAWRASRREQEVAELLALLRQADAALRSGQAESVGSGGCRSGASAALPTGVTPRSWPPGPPSSRVLLNLDETITKE